VFHARDDDVITSAGYRIGPSEIEAALLRHPDVVMAAVVGEPDPIRTEIVVAHVVLRDGADGAGIEAALKGQHFLAVNVSDARTFLRIFGSGAREVLAKVCPVDLSPEGFTPGMFRRTRMAQVPAAFWLDEAGNFHLICFRSVADYAFELLKVSAQPGGEVGLYA